MHPNIRQSPIATEAISNFGVVFDAIYTPLQTQLLKVSLNNHQNRGADPLDRHKALGLSTSAFVGIKYCDSIKIC
jgi:hypothetical protein